MKKKSLIMLVCALMIVSSVAFGTIAYLTDRAGVVNKFTLGNVDIVVDETEVDDEGNPVPEEPNPDDPDPDDPDDPDDDRDDDNDRDRVRPPAITVQLMRQTAEGEVPVGCVIVHDGQVVGRGRNRREEKQAVSSHAEMEAMAEANAALNTWRLEDCDLYVTLEPCPMCAGAIGWAQIPRIVYGCPDEKRGYREYAPRALHPKAIVTEGVLCEECKELMQSFFKSRRK